MPRPRSILILALAAVEASTPSAVPSSASVVQDAVDQELALRRQLVETPDSLEIRQALAAHMAAQGRVEEATSLLLTAGQQWLRAGKADQAIAALSTVVGLAPDSGKAHALLGRAQVLEGDYSAAVESLGTALDLGFRDVSTLLQLGTALWGLGDLDEAVQAYRGAVDLSLRAPVTLHTLGRLYLWSGRYDQAAEMLLEAAELSPGSIDLQHDLAQVLLRLGQFEEAIRAFKRSVELDPRNPEVHYGLGRALTQAGDREEAQKVFAVYRNLYREQQEWVREQGLSRARLNQGYKLLEEGQISAAIEHLESLGESSEVMVALSSAHHAAGDQATAIRYLERAVVLDPRNQKLRDLLREARLNSQIRP